MRHVDSTHTIVVSLPLAPAFACFTPAGEERWVDGWRPHYLHPADGRTAQGMVFTTGDGAEHTIWTLVDLDRDAHRVRYVRCTPGSRSGTVEVACRALDGERTQVTVRYALTALADGGEAALDAYYGARYAAMIDGWARLIAARRDELLAAAFR